MPFDDMPYNPRAVDDRTHVRLLAIDLITLDWTWHADGVRDGFWRLYRNRAPGAWVRSGGREVALVPGRVYLIPAWATFDCWNRGRVGHLFVHFDVLGWAGAVVRSAFDRLLELPARVPPPAVTATCDALEVELQARRHDEPTTALLAKAAACTALATVLEATPEPDRRVLHAGPGPVAPAVDYIETHLRDELSNDRLARVCYMSPSHFIRTFHRAVGQTPAQYVAERRIARAAQRLALSDAPVKEIADECGFANRYHFSRVFRAVMGVGPATYRKGQLVGVNAHGLRRAVLGSSQDE